MPYRPLILLALLLACLVPARAEPAACPVPPAPPNNPQAVAQAFLEGLSAYFMAGAIRTDDQTFWSLVTREEDLQDYGDGVFEVSVTYFWAGATAQAPTAATADHATVPVQGPPLHLALVVADGQWKIDARATYTALPAAMRAGLEPGFEFPPPPHPETAGAGGPPPPDESRPAPPAIAPALGTVTGTPLDTAQKALSVLRGWDVINGDMEVTPALTPLVADLPKHAMRLPEGDAILTFCLWAKMGAEAVASPPPTGATATVAVTTPPFQLVLARVEGQWKVDLQATYAALPEAVRQPFERERKRAQLAESTGQIKELALDARMYEKDHNGRLPDAAKWTDEILPYLQEPQVLLSPAAPQLKCAYAMNAALSGKRLEDLANAAEVVLFFESDLGTRNAAGGVEAICQPPRWEGGNLYAFADGHVELLAEAPTFTPKWK